MRRHIYYAMYCVALVLLPLHIAANTYAYFASTDKFCGETGGWQYSLNSDCFRIGAVWPAMSLLTLVITKYCADIKRHVMSTRQRSTQVYNNQTLAPFAALTLLLALSSATCIVISPKGWRRYQLANSSATGIFWSLATAAAIEYHNVNADSRLYSWPVAPVLARCAMTMSECYFTFFSPLHASDRVFDDEHFANSVALFTTSIMEIIVLFLLLLVAQKGACADSQKSDEYQTPLSQVCSDQHPSVSSPEDRASILSRLTFSWILPLLRQGQQHVLGFSDLYLLAVADLPLPNWHRYIKHAVPERTLHMALARTFAPELLSQLALSMVFTTLSFSGPFFMQRILWSIQEHQKNPGESRAVYVDAVGLLATMTLRSLTKNHALWVGRKICIRLQSFLVAEITDKALRRQKAPAGGPDHANAEGKLASILTSDFTKIAGAASYMSDLYSIPLQFAIGAWYLYSLLGVPALVGLALTALYYPVSGRVIAMLSSYNRRIQKYSDQRLSMITEMLKGMRAVKLFGWESRFTQAISQSRSQQLREMWLLCLVTLPINLVLWTTPNIIFIVVFGINIGILGQKLTADIVFPSLAVFYMISNSLSNISGFFVWMASSYVALSRVNEFLHGGHVQPLDERVDISNGSAGSWAEVGFVEAHLHWDVTAAGKQQTLECAVVKKHAPSISVESTEQSPLLVPCSRNSSSSILSASNVTCMSDSSTLSRARFSLKSISAKFPSGGFSIITGPTGSGKSSLLSALVGEMKLTSGRIVLPVADAFLADARHGSNYRDIITLTRQQHIFTDIAYVAQEAWLRNATIRENILFGSGYDQMRYEEVLRVCALKPDLRIFPAGDLTEVGERGIALSGGQRQRVALARAVYSSKQILLIDDCLSAVDASTGRHILHECLLNKSPLMHGRTRILVTHHVLACLKHCDYVLVLRGGQVALRGSPQEVQASVFFSEILGELDKYGAEDSCDTTMISKSTSGINDFTSEDTYNAEQHTRTSGVTPVVNNVHDSGYVKPHIWLRYIRACGSVWFWSTLAFLMVASCIVDTSEEFWIKIWINSLNDVTDTSPIPATHQALQPLVRYLSGSAAEPGPEHSTVFWLSWFVAIGFFVSAVRLIKWAFGIWGGMQASHSMHTQLLHRVAHANGRFFDITPIGHIISRFAQDIKTVDEMPIETISSALSQLTYSLIVLAIITYVTPPFAIVAVAVTAGYGLIARYYLGAQRELKRMELVTMEPLLSLFSEVIGGAVSIRAFGAQNMYIKEAMGRMDFHNRPFYLMWAANRWLSTSIECLSLIISFATAVCLFLRLDSIDSGIAGFVLVFATRFTDVLMMSIRSYSHCEQQLGSVERIDSYLSIEQERHEGKGIIVASDWPQHGAITVDGLVVEYTPGVPVLQSLTFHVSAGERIGIVGRTGAGKSTLSLAFLRFVEAAQGRIVVDGIDISQIGLDRLRNAIMIIPQDPVLFSGTIRFNLDPFDECPDEILLDALRRTCLLRDEPHTDNDGVVADMHVPGIVGSLEDKVEENGQNLSLGQRQLVALARALVRRSKIIIMDEATASVDFDTDSRFQRSVCTSEFAGSTLFCIAHRLRTIINYDRVLVLDKGKIAEFDTPAVLLGKRDSMFRTLCQQSGEFDQLVKCVC